MASLNLPEPDKLQEIYQSSPSKSLIIVVPGVGTFSPNTWFEGKPQTWSGLLPEDVLPSPSVYQFNHGLTLDTDSQFWSRVLHKGNVLFEELLSLFRAKDELRRRPIVFIAHSLGGIMVKHCVTLAHERKRDFRDIDRSIAILILLATPHSTSEDTKDWCLHQLLVETRAFHKKVSLPTADDARNLGNLCLRFEGVITDIHLLTLCETKETVIRRLFGKKIRVLLVPDKICKVNSALEEFIRIESDHLDIARVTPSHLLEKSVQRAVSATLARIEQEKLDLSASLPQESTMAQREALDGASIEAPDDPQISTSRKVRKFPSRDSKRGGHPLWDFSTTKRDPLLPCHVLPHAKNKYFHDRTDVLSLIEKNLAPVDEHGLPRKGLKIFALSGPGGMGKTQVANHYAWTHTDMYEAILWIHGEELSTLTDDFSRLAEHLGLVFGGSTDAMDPVLTRELVKGWMAKPVRSYNRANNSSAEEVSWLLIFDNVHNMDFLSDVWPFGASNGSILVTSRDTLAKSRWYESNGIDLRPMSDKDASDLLLKMTLHEDNQEEHRLSFEVADKLGGLPLALTQMAGVMVRLNLSFAQFLKRYEEDERHIALFRLFLEPKYKRTGYEHTLASVWALEKLEHSSGLLAVMAFLDPDGIPEEYLEGAVGKAALSDYPRSVTAYQDARAELLKSSLIMADGSSSKLTIHRLTQDVAIAYMNPDRMTEVFSTAVEILSLNWPEAARGVRHHVARWKQCESVSPHILRLKDRFLRAGERIKFVWTSHVKFAWLINELGWYFQERGRTDDALECYRIAETIVKDIKDKQLTETEEEKSTHILLAEIHNNMGGAETERNNPDKAFHHFQLYNKLLKDKYNGQSDISDSSLTTSYFNMGMSCTMKGNYQKAIEYMTQALQEAEKLGDPSNIKAARSLALINLGLTYWLMDRQEDASDILETALREREELLGPNDRQSMISGRALYGLGNVRRSQGRLHESLQFHERALLHFKETVGNNHHRTGNSCFKVAEHYCRTGKLDQALELLDQAIRIFRRDKCYAPEEGRAILMKSIILEQKGNSVESKLYLDKAVSPYESIEKAAVAGRDLSLKHFDRHVHVWGR